MDEKINVVCDFILEATSWAEGLKNVPIEQRLDNYLFWAMAKLLVIFKLGGGALFLSGIWDKYFFQELFKLVHFRSVAKIIKKSNTIFDFFETPIRRLSLTVFYPNQSIKHILMIGV